MNFLCLYILLIGTNEDAIGENEMEIEGEKKKEVGEGEVKEKEEKTTENNSFGEIPDVNVENGSVLRNEDSVTSLPDTDRSTPPDTDRSTPPDTDRVEDKVTSTPDSDMVRSFNDIY